MSEEELDAAIAERFKTYEEGVRLPCGFKGRFIVSVRRKRTLRCILTLGLICMTAAASVTVANLARPVDTNNSVRYSLTAKSSDSKKTTQVSYWVLLGYLRECFSRCRPSRRKEEE